LAGAGSFVWNALGVVITLKVIDSRTERLVLAPTTVPDSQGHRWSGARGGTVSPL
jgi:hypothetical protein